MVATRSGSCDHSTVEIPWISVATGSWMVTTDAKWVWAWWWSGSWASQLMRLYEEGGGEEETSGCQQLVCLRNQGDSTNHESFVVSPGCRGYRDSGSCAALLFWFLSSSCSVSTRFRGQPWLQTLHGDKKGPLLITYPEFTSPTWVIRSSRTIVRPCERPPSSNDFWRLGWLVASHPHGKVS